MFLAILSILQYISLILATILGIVVFIFGIVVAKKIHNKDF